MKWGAGYVCIVLHKETKVYKIGSSEDLERKFKDLGVGDTTELIKSYWVINPDSVVNSCYKDFKDKILPESQYLQLTKEDLKELKRILKKQKLITKIVVKQERDAKWVERLRKERDEYSKSNERKKFILRHNNKFNGAFGCGFSLLVLSPLVAFAVMVLKAYGISRYFLLLPIFGLFFLVLWGSNRDDEYQQTVLLGDEEDLIKKHRESWKSIDAKTDAYEEKNEK